MGWIARFAGWATLVAFPCWLLMPAYQRVLGKLASVALKVLGLDVEFEDVMVTAPMDLGLFAAMCLSSFHVPIQRRIRALVFGLPILVAGEIVIVAVFVLMTIATGANPGAQVRGSRAAGYIVESIPWVNAAAAWLALLGGDELPDMSRAKRSGSLKAGGRRLRDREKATQAGG